MSVTRRARSTIFHVEGRLTEGNLEHLERIVATTAAPTVLNLSNLMSADDAGVATLRSLAGRGARLVGATPYVALLLADEIARPPRGRARRPRKR